MEKGLGMLVKTKKINRDTKSWSSGGGGGKKKKKCPRDKMVAFFL